MTISSARGITRSRVALLAMMALTAIGMSACSSSDGKDGANGQPGAPGATGPTGPAGPPGPGATTEPRESCAVCHDDGSVYAIADMHSKTSAGLPLNVAKFTLVKFTTGGVGNADLILSFNVKVDGVNRTDFNSISNDYRFYVDGTGKGQRRDLTDDGNALTLGNAGNGNYTITITEGALDYGLVNSRYTFRIATALGSAGPRPYLSADWPEDAQDPNMVSGPTDVSDGTCAKCHGPYGQGFHRSSQMNGLTCSVCHDDTAVITSYPDAKYMTLAHGIHNSEGMPEGYWIWENPSNATRNVKFEVAYPTYMSNCSVCHDTPAALAEANAMTVSGENCLSCHGDMTSWEENFTASGALFHLGYTGAEDCTTCHNTDPDAAAPGLVVVTDFHNGLETANVGIIEDGADLSIELGKLFTWEITSVTDDATTGQMTVNWTATYKGVPVDPCNTAIDADHPGFVPATGVVLDGAPGMLRTYMQGNDYILGQATNEPGQPSNVNLYTAANATATNPVNTTCASNVATTTFSRGTVPTGATVGILALQGKPMLPLPASVDPAVYPYTYMYVRVPTPTYQFVVGTGAASTDVRRSIVDDAKCLSCHVGSLYQHGNTRVDNTLMCTVCHNSASSEQSVRVGMGVTASEAYDGLVGQTFELKTMLHRIHTAGEPAGNPFGAAQPPFVIYRNRGIYAFALDTASIPNWDATLAQTPCGTGEGGVPKYLVYGADPANPNSCQPFNFMTPTYPRLSTDCYACHTDGSVDNAPLQSEAVATTLDAGSTTWINKIDDTLQGASAAACTSCHTSTAAKGHAYQNGWVPQVFPEGRQTILDTP